MGAKTRLIYDNLWRKGTMGTVEAVPYVSSEDPQHPATDTQIDTLSMYWKASDNEAEVTIPIDQDPTLGAIDFVAILGHNIESSGVVITLEGDDNAAFDDGDGNFVSRTINYYATSIFQFVETFTRQYVRIKLVRAEGVFPTLPKIATILCGSYLEFNRRFAPEYEIGEEDFSEMEYSDSQVLFSQQRETLNVRRYSYQALDTNPSANGILAMFEECKTIKAFAVCLDHTAPNTNTYWVRNSELNAPVCRNGVWYWDMAITEII